MTTRDIKPMPVEEMLRLKNAVEDRWTSKPWYNSVGAGSTGPKCMMDGREILSLIAAVESPVLAEDFCGRVAYALTQRMVIDMPTARAAIDAAVDSILKEKALEKPEN